MNLLNIYKIEYYYTYLYNIVKKSMKFFIDTANLNQIKEMQELGIIDGVTTNPSLLAKECADPIEQLKKICKILLTYLLI